MHVVQDFRCAVRALLAQPAYVATALATLALGIGFSTATFSVVHAVLLHPLPYSEPERLVRLIERNLPRFPQFSVSPGHYLFWRDHNLAFEGIAASAFHQVTLDLEGGDPQRVRADRVSGNLFQVLGVEAHLGRVIEPTDEAGPYAQVAVLSYGTWQRRFGGAPIVVGETIRVDRRPVTIVGVMPERFRYGSNEVEMWIPLVFTDAERRSFGSHFMTAIGRLKPGVSIEQADQDMKRVSRALSAAHPGSEGWDVLLFGMQEYLVRDVRESLMVLFGAVSLVLLIACANVANLLLARGAARQKELAIRASLGATRARLVRQLLAEQVMLAVASTAAGVLIAAWLVRALLALAPDVLPMSAHIGLNGAVLGFAVALAVATPIVFGLLPALHASRADLRAVVAAGGRQAAGAPARRTRTALVVAEVAIAMALLVAAGLLFRSFVHLSNQAPGFEPGGVVLTGVSLPVDKYPAGHPRERFMGDFLGHVGSLPGVDATGLSVPMAMVTDFNSSYEVEGEPTPVDGRPLTLFYAVSAGFFDAMRIPLLRGRYITEQDRRGGQRVIVINEFMAERHFGGADPIGRRIRVSQGNDDWREIVGVVGNVKQTGLAERPRAQVYESYLQHPYFSSFSFVVRTSAPDPTAVIPQVRSVLRSLDAELPLAQVKTLADVVDSTVRPQRLSTALIGVFGVAAAALAAIGLYGVVAYTVGLRRQEFAIRIAHGATSRDILALVLRGAAAMTAAGVVIGFGAAWVAGGVLQNLLFEVSSADPLTYAAVALILTGTTLLASFVPAVRAMHVDPVDALRE